MVTTGKARARSFVPGHHWADGRTRRAAVLTPPSSQSASRRRLFFQSGQCRPRVNGIGIKPRPHRRAPAARAPRGAGRAVLDHRSIDRLPLYPSDRNVINVPRGLRCSSVAKYWYVVMTTHVMSGWIASMEMACSSRPDAIHGINACTCSLRT